MARESPHQGVHCGRVLREEVPGGIVGSTGLWDFIIGTGFYSVDKIGELHGILDEERWDIVSNDVWSRHVSIRLASN